MAFRMNERPLYKPHGPLPLSAKPAVRAVGIPDILNSDVSLLRCMAKMADWALLGEANCAIALVMWSLFVVALTWINVLMLVLSSWRLFLGLRSSSRSGESAKETLLFLGSCPFMAVAKVLKKLAML